MKEFEWFLWIENKMDVVCYGAAAPFNFEVILPDSRLMFTEE